MAEIQIDDLFASNVKAGIHDIGIEVNSLYDSLVKMQAELKASSVDLVKLMQAYENSKKGRSETQKLAKAIEELDKVYSNLSQEQQKLYQATTKSDQARSASMREQIRLAQQMTRVANEQNQVNVKATSIVDIENASYNNLAATYNVLKQRINAMTKAERELDAENENLIATAEKVYSQMKKLQESTGKHTLSVGDYSKAFNGLNIATQQVLREMPTLANSFSQFFIAISNNVPILTDAFKRVRVETGSFMTALGGVLKSVFSWQTALLALLTILPQVARAIEKKRKAQKEAAETTSWATSIEKIHIDTLSAEANAIDKMAGVYKILLRVMQDENKLAEDRKAAQQAIIRGMGDQAKQYGTNIEGIKKYIEKLELQAEVESQVARIMELNGKIRDANSKILEIQSGDKYIKAQEKLSKAQEKQASWEERLAQVRKDLSYAKGTQTYTQYEENWAKVTEKRQKAVEKADNAVKALTQSETDLIKNSQTEIENIYNKLDKIHLDELNKITESGESAKEASKELGDYYWEWKESVIKTTTDGLAQQTALIALRYDREKDGLEKELEERRKNGTLTAEVEKQLTELLKNLEKEKWNDIAEIRNKYFEKQNKEADKTIKEWHDRDVKQAQDALKIATNLANEQNANIVRRNMAIGQAEVEYWDKMIETAKRYGGEYLKDIELFASNRERAMLKATTGKTDVTGQQARMRQGGLLYKILYGESVTENKPVEEIANFISNLKTVYNQAMAYMDDIIAKRMELAQAAIDAAEKETEAARTIYEYELEARANGYANNVEYARKEYEEKIDIEKKAIAEKERLQQIQESMDTAQQVSSLVTATANLLSSYSTIPYVGQALAIAAIAAMWGTFAAAKLTASQLAGTKTYGEGGMEYMNYGGSHASGNDIDFGRTRDGKSRRVERGEVVGIINKRSVAKYGVGEIGNLISSLNNGTFDTHSLAFQGATTIQASADLGNIEDGIGTLITQGKSKVVSTPNGRIEYRGNNKRIIRNS